jgi:acyl-CoA hydrolase
MQILDEFHLWEEIARMRDAGNSVPRVVISGNFATPWETLAVVDSALPEYRLFAANFQKGPVPGWLPGGFRPGIIPETVFIGPGMRGQPDLRYCPMRLGLAPRMFWNETPPDIVVIHTTPIDPATGKVSLGIEVNVLPAAVRACHRNGGIVIAQINHRMPYTYGDGELSPGGIDFGLEADEELASPEPVEPTDIQRQIAANVAELIPDGATLQGGIGAVPDAVVAMLASRPMADNAEGYHVWTEMFGDGVMALDEAGRLQPYIVASFMFGSPRLYKWVDHNRRVRLYETQTVNDPATIASHPLMVSINTALEVDLFGQVNGGYVKGQFYSGFGGQTDYVQGALHSDGGLAIIALPSMHPKAGVSTIVPSLHGPATSIQPSYVVTENGAAKIAGEDAPTQAANLARIAHPVGRDVLRVALEDKRLFDALR